MCKSFKNRSYERKLSSYKSSNRYLEDSDDSIEENNKRVTSRKKANGKENIVIYKIFMDASEYTEDDYWKAKLELASYNKFPKNISYKNGKLVFYAKTGPKSEVLPKKPKHICEAFIAFVKKNTTLRSDLDIRATPIIQQKKKAKINKNEFYIPLIKAYVETQSIENEFNRKTKNDMMFTIMYGFIIGAFNKKTIILNEPDEDSEDIIIEYIEGLMFNKKTSKFSIDPDVHEKYANKMMNNTDIGYGKCKELHKCYQPNFHTKDKHNWDTVKQQIELNKSLKETKYEKIIVL